MNKKNLKLFIGFIIIIGCILIFIYVCSIIFKNNSILPVSSTINNADNSMISSIEVATSNAISSSTLIVTVIGVFMTSVSIFAAILVFTSTNRLDKVEAKAKEMELKTQLIENTSHDVKKEAFMRHVFTGIQYINEDRYDYAKEEFDTVLGSCSDDECLLIVNYRRGLLSGEMFAMNHNINTINEAINFYKKAITYDKKLNYIVWASASAELGCVLGLKYEYFNYGALADLLTESINHIKNAITSDDIANYHENLAITYALQNDINNSLDEFNKYIKLDADSRDIIDKDIRKERAKGLIKKLFSEKERDILSEAYEKINKQLLNSNN